MGKVSIVRLVERHTQVAVLAAALEHAGAGRGSVVLVAGEDGAGKTALVRKFTSEASVSRRRVLWGMCDELMTPRPLGPFRDVIGHLIGDLAGMPPARLLEAVQAELGRPPHPAVVVVEDAQWADEATLDAIRFLGRRIAMTPALLVVTFRDNEVPADHPLRRAVGEIPPDDLHRVVLPRLSRRAVATLAGHDDIDELYRLTGGNAFFVTEALAAPGADVPSSVQHAVMARVGQLSAVGRECVETASVIPTRAARWILDACGVGGGVDEAVMRGVIHVEDDVVCFSHELARRAVEQCLPPAQRRMINQQVLEVLATADADPAVLAHHAVQAEEPSAVVRFAPVAARAAASLNAHRQAVDHFQQALACIDLFTGDQLVELLEEYAHECQLTGQHKDAKEALLRAIEMRRAASQKRILGADLCQLSDVHWFQGRSEVSEAAAAEAVATLEELPPGPELAKVYSQRSKLAMLDFRIDEAVRWGDKAVEVARLDGDVRVLSNALTSAGVARWQQAGDNGLLVEGLQLAKDNGFTDEAARAYNNLAAQHTNLRQYAAAARYIADALAYCDEHDLIARSTYLIGTRAWGNMAQGRWSEAEDDARCLLTADCVSRITGSWVLAWLQVRKGEPDAESTLEEACLLAERSGEKQHIYPATQVRAELAWLCGNTEVVAETAAAMLDVAAGAGNPRWIGEAALWLHRVGALTKCPGSVPEPFASQIAGKWQEAAEMWSELGLPYEEADALADAPEPEPLLQALHTLDCLGAAPRAAMVRKRLADMGIASVPRGPREETRASPAGLTCRQTEILHHLAEDLTYQEIAQRLYLSVKTVDHHVAAVRAKFGVTTRAEAVAAGRRLGILGSEAPDRAGRLKRHQ